MTVKVFGYLILIRIDSFYFFSSFSNLLDLASIEKIIISDIHNSLTQFSKNT